MESMGSLKGSALAWDPEHWLNLSGPAPSAPLLRLLGLLSPQLQGGFLSPWLIKGLCEASQNGQLPPQQGGRGWG